ncbi:Zn-ribbon domain-containing OB-fold protein [Dehalococcoidia bacterium]|nr:Zn-ribbon domain-containing OB-fold protein [Dehalococcoidia bacterium]
MPLNVDPASVDKIDTTMAPYDVLPIPDTWSKPFWDGAREHKLMIQRCKKCGHYSHPPTFICMGCKDRDAELGFEQVSGQGTVYAWFIHHDLQVGGFESKTPYLVAAIELIEQSRLLIQSNILNCRYGDIEIGMPVEVVWETASTEITIPQFQPVKG